MRCGPQARVVGVDMSAELEPGVGLAVVGEQDALPGRIEYETSTVRWTGGPSLAVARG